MKAIIALLKVILFGFLVTAVVYGIYLSYYQDAFTGFLDRLNDKQASKYTAHQDFYNAILRLDRLRWSPIAADKPIPADYEFFLREVIPRFLGKNVPADSPKPNSPEMTDDPYLIAKFQKDTPYSAAIVVDVGSQKIGNSRLPAYAKRLEMAGTYTSEFGYPTGLTMIDGVMINPALQTWDGLIMIYPDGKVHLRNINALEYGFRQFDIAASYRDYLDFLDMLKQQKISVLQTHLLITNGEVDVTLKTDKAFRRRVIFEDATQNLGIYDSFDKLLTLYELAVLLRQEYHAITAVNLDMGTYSYCALYEQDRLKKTYGVKERGVKLSNIIIFHY